LLVTYANGVELIVLIHSIEEIHVRRAALHVARLVVCCASGPTQALASPASEHTTPAAIYRFAQEDFVTFRAALRTSGPLG